MFSNLSFDAVSTMAGNWLGVAATPVALILGLLVFMFVIDLVIGAIAKRRQGSGDGPTAGE